MEELPQMSVVQYELLRLYAPARAKLLAFHAIEANHQTCICLLSSITDAPGGKSNWDNQYTLSSTA